MKQMTCMEYFEKHFDNENLSEQFDEMYWAMNFSSDKLFKEMCYDAKERGIQLTDEEYWEYDEVFWNAYKSTEKGLS